MTLNLSFAPGRVARVETYDGSNRFEVAGIRHVVTDYHGIEECREQNATVLLGHGPREVPELHVDDCVVGETDEEGLGLLGDCGRGLRRLA